MKTTLNLHLTYERNGALSRSGRPSDAGVAHHVHRGRRAGVCHSPGGDACGCGAVVVSTDPQAEAPMIAQRREAIINSDVSKSHRHE
eukprot:1190120-Prorocentrum_minimum.AAC.2